MSTLKPTPRTRSLLAAVAAVALTAMAAGPASALQTRPADAAAAGVAAPATAPAATGEALEATITGVQGFVQVRGSDAEDWRPARVGMVLGPGAEFRTATRSAVRFTIPPGQTITLDRLGTVKLLEAARTAGAIKTDLGMKYGRVRYDIEAAGQSYDARIHSPGASLAVRGTRVSLENSAPFPPVAISLTGRARFESDGKGQTFGGTARSEIDGAIGDAAGTAEVGTLVDPSLFGARGGDEQMAMVSVPALAGFTGGVKVALGSIRAPRPGTPGVPIDQVGGNLLPGSLVFQLVWVPTVSNNPADLDLLVTSPLGEALRPKGGPARVPSGGIGPVDDQGQRSFGGGQETAVWPSGFPAGSYTYGVRHASGTSAQYQVLVFRNQNLLESRSGTLSAGGSAGFNTTLRDSTTPGSTGEPAAPTSSDSARAARRTRTRTRTRG